MRAKLIDDNIVWVATDEEYLSYKTFLEKRCSNPRMADDSLSPYYDHVLKEIAILWSNKEEKDFPADTIFGISKSNFIACMNHYVLSDYTEFPMFMFDLTYFVANNSECPTRYDIFVGFIREFSKALLIKRGR